jgi:uncharacterized membrane protein HdeD (DUF308 family)
MKEYHIMSSVIIASVADKAVNELWWIGIIEAALALFFGISAIFWPGLTLLALVYLFSAFVIGLGIVQLVAGLMSIKRRSSWWVTVLIGVVSLGVGIYLVRNPGVSFITFILLVGLVLIVRGLLDLMRAFTDRSTTSDTTNKIFLILVGIAGLVAGVLILLQPAAGGVAFVWILGLYAILIGTLGIVGALELRAALFVEPEKAKADIKERQNVTREVPGRTHVKVRNHK